MRLIKFGNGYNSTKKIYCKCGTGTEIIDSMVISKNNLILINYSFVAPIVALYVQKSNHPPYKHMFQVKYDETFQLKKLLMAFICDLKIIKTN